MRKRLLYTLPILGVLLLAGCGAPAPETGGNTGQAATTEQDGDTSVAESSGAEGAESNEGAEAIADSEAPTVLFLGDSITAGLGLEPEQAFPALLQERLDSLGVAARLINAGLSGETSAGGLRRVDWLMRRPIDVLVLELGGNDGLRGVDLSSTASNLQGIIDRVMEENPETVVVVAGMMIPTNLGQEYTSAFAGIYPRLAEENDAILIPFILDGIGGVDSLMQGDQIHPNAAGHRAAARLVEPYLLEALRAVPE